MSNCLLEFCYIFTGEAIEVKIEMKIVSFGPVDEENQVTIVKLVLRAFSVTNLKRPDLSYP